MRTGPSSFGEGPVPAPLSFDSPKACQERRWEMDVAIGIGFLVIMVLGLVFGEDSDDAYD